jgi:hypothetical protein
VERLPSQRSDPIILNPRAAHFGIHGTVECPMPALRTCSNPERVRENDPDIVCEGTPGEVRLRPSCATRPMAFDACSLAWMRTPVAAHGVVSVVSRLRAGRQVAQRPFARGSGGRTGATAGARSRAARRGCRTTRCDSISCRWCEHIGGWHVDRQLPSHQRSVFSHFFFGRSVRVDSF